jgi:hypothetical protein
VEARFARREKIRDAVLLEAARAEKGHLDADLGGGVIKQRIARPGQGKSRGYRTIILFKQGQRAVFIYGFAKRSGRISTPMTRRSSRRRHATCCELTGKQITELVKEGDFVEVKGHEEEISK